MELRIDLHHTDWLHELAYPLLFFAVPLAISLGGFRVSPR